MTPLTLLLAAASASAAIATAITATTFAARVASTRAVATRHRRSLAFLARICGLVGVDSVFGRAGWLR